MNDKKILELKNLQFDLLNNDLSKSSKYFRVTNNFNGKFVSGNLTAILGDSGCGKSQLFNLITGDISKNDLTSGEILYNNKERNFKEWITQISYLPQDDLYYPKLTLLESLNYYAEFYKINLKERQIFIEKILNDCRIYSKKDLKIESLSGGERKRAMLCIAMLKQPEILILDEPTTGLDSHNALMIVDSLKKYAVEKNAIVILTAHQPGEALFYLFDDLMYLTKRGQFYQGKILDLEKWLADHEMFKPDKISISEFMFELTADDTVINEAKILKNKVEEIINLNNVVTHQTTNSCNNIKIITSNIPDLKHIKILLKRNLKLFYRSNTFWISLLLKFFFIISYLIYFAFSKKNLFKKVKLGESYSSITLLLGYGSIYDLNLSYFSAYHLYFLFINYLLVFFISYNDSIIFDELLYNYEIKSLKYSSVTYAAYQLIMLILTDFTSIAFYLATIVIMILQYNLSAKLYFYLYFFAGIYSIFYTISYLFLSVLPIPISITNFSFLICSTSDLNLGLQMMFTKFPFLKFLNIIYLLFPCYYLNGFFFFDMYSLIQKNNFFNDTRFTDLFKSFFNIIDFCRFSKLPTDTEKFFKIFFFKEFYVDKFVYIIYLIFSFSLCASLYFYIWTLRKSPNIRLRLNKS